MRLAITLISAAPDPGLVGFAAKVRAALAVAPEPVWLAVHEACDLFIDLAEPQAVAACVRAILGGAAIDVVVQPAALRRKRLLVADLESTIIANEMLDELGALLGIAPQIAAITRRAMAGEIDFGESLAARAALLAGAKADVLAAAASRIRFTNGARTLVATMHRAGAMTALVTGGFAIFADAVGAELGFDRVIANRLEIADGLLTGRIEPPVLTAEGKRQALLALAAEQGVAPARSIAVGDGANDIAMLKAAGLGVAFHAKPVVAAEAAVRLDHADLTGLLYAQGYRKADCAAAAGHPQL
jgi:phosphoserine phosphatase